MKRNTNNQQRLLGAAERTGTFLSKGDFGQLLEVIAKAKAQDNMIKLSGIQQLGHSNLGSASMGSMAIQDFVRKLVKAYGFNDSNSVLYGVNKHGEIMRWVSPEDLSKRG